MIRIASAFNVNLFWISDGFLSFTNSPYYGHTNLHAVDLYPHPGQDEALSPVEGTVKTVERLKLIDDYLIIIEASPNVYVKILHVTPSVQRGSEVSPEDVIGRFQWSPFFHLWTDLHMHVELRNKKDPIRARGGYELDITPLLTQMRLCEGASLESTFTVAEVDDRYILLESEKKSQPFTTPLTIRFGEETCFLEGGLPHYGHGALISPHHKIDTSSFLIKGDFVRQRYLHFTCDNNHLRIGRDLWRGVGAYINRPFLKLIPVKPGDHHLKLGDELSLTDLSLLFNKQK